MDAKVICGTLAQAGLDFLHVTEHDITRPAFGEGPTLADLIALGKPALANRDWPRRARRGEALASFDFNLLLPMANIKGHEL